MQETRNIQDLPDVLLQELKEFSSEPELKELEGVSKTMYALFQPKTVLLDKFLQCVAFGMQDKVEQLFSVVYRDNAAKIQEALEYQGQFTDYSGRSFHCTAYEYAYWAKDTHMCRMLERYMDEETKAHLLARINENNASGLPYRQNDEIHRSTHFDFSPLQNAYQNYISGFDAWVSANNLDEINIAWLDIGLAQRDVPAHVAQEYCQHYRRFYPCPSFDEPTLRRKNLDFQWWKHALGGNWFPLSKSFDELGASIGIVRSSGVARALGRWQGPLLEICHKDWAIHDLIAITRLDEVRTRELLMLREDLNSSAVSHVFGS